ncbi:putative PAP2 superfamily [Blattamonas nauphoetae]|uniref:PAP2 superfamily n=1 Tax=Blattamonas nauphoetae TaxID=2049346 RepID=A0ABQ9X8J5_9EUKA|nr:putative PAP2 superfamily [Blattamonas nauphoetae]
MHSREVKRTTPRISSGACWRFLRNLSASILPFFACFLYFERPDARPFNISWPHIQKPHVENEFVSTKLLCLTSFVIAGISCIVYTVTSRSPRRTFFCSLLGYLGGLAFVEALTVVLKTRVLRFRPDFLDRCKPDKESMLRLTNEVTGEFLDTLTTDIICTGSAKAIREGRHSFPSGHASLSAWSGFFAATLCLCRLYQYLNRDIIGHHLRETKSDQTQTPNTTPVSPTSPETAPPRRIINPRDCSMLIALFLMSFMTIFGSIIVSVSRVANHWHHPSDVFVGYAFGLAGGLISGGMTVALEDDEDYLYNKNSVN